MLEVIYFKIYDPTDADGSFVDRGYQYTSAIFYHDEEQRKIARTTLDTLNKSGRFEKPIVTPISEFKIFYKAELLRLEEGNISVYIYDYEMNPVKLSKFDKKATGEVEAMVKKKITTTSFKLAQEEDAFTGKAPKAKSKPFNIAITFKEGKRELLAVFENLD